MNSFVFATDSNFARGDDALIVDVPLYLEDKKALFAWYANSLSLPNYFGANWDALDECLRDLSWIQQRKIILVHSKLPLSGNKADQLTYVEMLNSVVQSWNSDDAHDITVIFDPSCQSAINALTAGA